MAQLDEFDLEALSFHSSPSFSSSSAYAQAHAESASSDADALYDESTAFQSSRDDPFLSSFQPKTAEVLSLFPLHSASSASSSASVASSASTDSDSAYEPASYDEHESQYSSIAAYEAEESAAAAHLQQPPGQHQLLSLGGDSVAPLYPYADYDDYAQHTACMSDECEDEEGGEEGEDDMEDEEEEETPTPALAAVPPAEIVTATIADPNYVINPAFAAIRKQLPLSLTAAPLVPPPHSLLQQHSTRTVPGLAAAVVPLGPPLPPPSSTAAAPLPLPPAAAAAASASPTKRKYTKRAQTAASALPSVDQELSQPSAAAVTASASNAMDVCVTVDAPAAVSAAAAADDFAANVMRPASPPPAAVIASPNPAAAPLSGASHPQSPMRRSRSVSDDADDNASVGSSHSRLSAQSAPLLSSAAAAPAAAAEVASEGSSTPPPLRVEASPSASPSSSPASSPRSISSSSSPPRERTTPPLQDASTISPSAKPGRKRKIKTEAAVGSAASAEKAASSPASDTDSGSDSVTAAASSCSPSADGLDGKRLVRLQRNRASAQLSRERKKHYMSELEQRLRALAQVNAALESQLGALHQENAQLKQRLGEDSVGVVSAVPVTAAAGRKRARLSQAHKRSIGGGEGGGGGGGVTAAGRTTLLMFSLIFSFAIFYSMVGIDLHRGDKEAALILAAGGGAAGGAAAALPSQAFAHPFTSRVLQSLRDSDSNESGSRAEPLAIEPPPSPSARLPASPSSRALIAVDTSAEHKALVVKEEEERAGAAALSASRVYDSGLQYRTGNGSEELKTSNKTYLLCPDAMSIRPMLVSDVQVKRERQDGEDDGSSSRAGSASAKRLRRTLGLPSPDSVASSSFSSVATTSGAAPSPASGSAKLSLAANDHLLLWLPSSDLDMTQTGSSSSGSVNASSGAAEAGKPELVQISCQISSIQPVFRA